MKGLFKRLVVGVTSVAMVASMGTAFAQTEMSNMVFAGYDTTNPYEPHKVYNEVINGQYSNKQILVPVEPEWREEGFEAVYPHAGYSRMYLEGNPQEITVYNQLSPQWETRRRDYMWEMKEPHRIYERQQTKIQNQTWAWDFGNAMFGIPDSALLTPTHREAVVLNEEMRDYGFGIYKNNGDVITAEEAAMYAAFNITEAIVGETTVVNDENEGPINVKGWFDLLEDELSVESLSAKDDHNRYIMTDEMIANLIPVVRTKYVTAKFNDYNNDGLMEKNVADEYLKVQKYIAENGGDGWDWDYGYGESFDIVKTAEISWTAPGYEMEEPYLNYQYLIVNGVVLDGRDVDGDGEPDRDRVYRYTGGKANPVITWKFDHFQPKDVYDGAGNYINNVYEVVERKYVDGVPAVNADGEPVYRIPTGKYGNTYFVVKARTIEYWVVDDQGNQTLLNIFDRFTGTIEGTVDDGVYNPVDLVNAFTNGITYYVGGVNAD